MRLCYRKLKCACWRNITKWTFRSPNHSTKARRIREHQNEQRLSILPAVQLHQHFIFLSRVRFAQDQLEYWQNDIGREHFDIGWIGNINVEASFGFGKECVIAFRVLRLHAQECGSRQTIEVAICCARLPTSIGIRFGAEFRRKGFECRMDLQSGKRFVERCQRGLNAVPHDVRGFFAARGGNGLCLSGHANVYAEMGKQMASSDLVISRA